MDIEKQTSGNDSKIEKEPNKLYGYNEEYDSEVRLVDCMGLNVAEIAALMPENEKSDFLKKVQIMKTSFPEDWKLPDEETKVYRQGQKSVVFDAGGEKTFVLYLDSGGIAPFPKGGEFQW